MFNNPYYPNLYNPVQSPYSPVLASQGLNGRIIAQINEVAANEVPMDGNPALFPTRDMRQIYVKRWNPNGTISTNVYELKTPAVSDEAEVAHKATTEIEVALKATLDEINEGVHSLLKTAERINNESTRNEEDNVRPTRVRKTNDKSESESKE